MNSMEGSTMLKHWAFYGLTGVFVTIGLATSSCTRNVEIDNALHIEMKGNIKGLDPINANDLYSGQVISAAYEPLYQYKYLKRPLELEPLLAEALPEISKDGLTYT